MAIMSTYSSVLISVSSISAYDIYKTYINPRATGKQLMRVNYISMTAFALFMGGFSTMLYYIGVGMGYLYLLMGVIISSAVAPAAMTMIWKDQVRNQFRFLSSVFNINHF
jgi:Na+/proline symporter